MKEPGRPLRGVVNYRGFKHITKPNNVSLPHCDEMLDRFGKDRYFSKLYRKISFH